MIEAGAAGYPALAFAVHGLTQDDREFASDVLVALGEFCLSPLIEELQDPKEVLLEGHGHHQDLSGEEPVQAVLALEEAQLGVMSSQFCLVVGIGDVQRLLSESGITGQTIGIERYPDRALLLSGLEERAELAVSRVDRIEGHPFAAEQGGDLGRQLGHGLLEARPDLQSRGQCVETLPEARMGLGRRR